MYNKHQCRGTACTEASTEYAHSYRHLVSINRYDSGLVDVAPAREKIIQLQTIGYGYNQIAKMAGLNYNTIHAIVHGEPWAGKKPRARVQRDVVTQIRSITPDPAKLPPRSTVDGTGTRRRIQALHALGFSNAYIAGRLGVNKANFRRSSNSKQVTVKRACEVREIYEELWDKHPDVSTVEKRRAVTATKRWALKNDWPPPMAWDDDHIDNPKAKPSGTRKH